MQEAGAELERAGDSLQRLVEKQDQESARVYSGQASSDFYLKELQRFDESKAGAAPGAPNFTPDFLKGYDERADAVLKAAPDATSRRFLQQHLQSLRTQLGQNALSFEAGAIRTDRMQRHGDAIDNWAKVVQQDPGQFTNALQVLEQTRPAVGPDGAEKLADVARKTLTNAAAATMLELDPNALREATGKAMGEGGHQGATGVPWVDAATADQVRSWNAAATGRIRQQENELMRDAQARDKLAGDAFKEATTFSESGKFFSPEYETRLLGAVKGTQFEAEAQKLVMEQRQAVGFSSAPASARVAAVGTLAQRGATPGVGTDPTNEKVLDRYRKTQAAIDSAAKDNAWAAAPIFGVRGIDSTPAQITTPQDVVQTVQKRLAQIGQLEQWTGRTESPLQPQEAEQTARLLRTLPPDQAAAMLGQIGAAVGKPERIAQVAGQLSKTDRGIELAMLLAGDKTNAGRAVAEVVLRGQKALADKTVKRDDTALTGWKAEIASQVNGTLGNPEDEQRIKDAAFYVLAAANDGASQTGAFQLRTNASDAIALVAGAPIERGGVRTLLPRGMKEADFDAALRRFTPEVLAGMGQGGKLYSAGKEVAPAVVANRLTSLPVVRFGAGYAPMINGRPLTTDAAGQSPLVLKVAP